MVKIKKIRIVNFKSFEDVTINCDPNLNVITGVNNAGKTNLLEAIFLWHQCFRQFIKESIQTKDTLREASNKYLYCKELKAIRITSIDDIFYEYKQNKPIQLIVSLELKVKKKIKDLEVGFLIETLGSEYQISPLDAQIYNRVTFSDFFPDFLEPINISFTSPTTNIQLEELFVTPPQILDSIRQRQSLTIIRNRLYFFHYDIQGIALYNRFQRDLAYILFNDASKKISFIPQSSIQNDTKVVVKYKLGMNDIEKDIALLGSGTLQILTILLNLYIPEQNSYLNIILLDEPDSHIHRNIQVRLLDVLLRFEDRTQIFLTTHNESLIRQTSLNQLFHIDGNSAYEYYPVSNQELTTKVDARFKGIYPSALNPIISSLGSSSGLDFINAIEADRIIFVEGQDDAKAIYSLLQQNTLGVNSKKYVFWVLGGISNLFQDLPSYKTVFEKIRNQKTLWEKSTLIFDRDYLTDDHRQNIREKLTSKFGIQTFISKTYTFESVLFTDFRIFNILLGRWLKLKGIHQQDIKAANINANALRNEYLQHMSLKIDELKHDSQEINETIYRYKAVRDHLKQKDFFGVKDKSISTTDVQLSSDFRDYLESISEEQHFYKYANKSDVQDVINKVIEPLGIAFNIEQNFLELIELVDHSTWFEEWDFLTDL